MATSTVSAPEQPRLSIVERLTNMFFAPSKTFTDLNRDTSWWAAWLLISVFAFLFIFAVQKQVGFEQVTKNEIAASPKATERIDKLPPEARDNTIRVQSKVSQYITYCVPVFLLIYGVVIGAVLMGTFNFAHGAEVKFGTALAIVMFAWVPGILKSVLAAIALFAGADPEGFSIRNPVATNLGFFVSRIDHPVLQSMLSWVDIFAIWYIILIGIGFSCVSRVKRGAAISTVAGWYILVALVGTAFTALMS
jgi:Yip1 domain